MDKLIVTTVHTDLIRYSLYHNTETKAYWIKDDTFNVVVKDPIPLIETVFRDTVQRMFEKAFAKAKLNAKIYMKVRKNNPRLY